MAWLLVWLMSVTWFGLACQRIEGGPVERQRLQARVESASGWPPGVGSLVRGNGRSSGSSGAKERDVIAIANAAGWRPSESPIPFTAEVAVAMELKALPGRGQLALRWSPVSGAVRYRLYWRRPKAKLWRVMELPATQHLQTSVEPGAVHGFRVQALDGDGQVLSQSPLEQFAASGRFRLNFVGSGELPQWAEQAGQMGVLNGQRLAFADMIHITILGDAFLADEAEDFNRDVENWLASVFAIDSFRELAQSMVVWSRFRASAGRLGQGSHYRLRDLGLRARLGRDSPDLIWAEIDEHPFPPRTFYPSRWGHATRRAKLAMVIVLIHPSEGRPPFHGMAKGIVRDGQSGGQLTVALGEERVHEFGHALAFLLDEYLDDRKPAAGSPRRSGWHSRNVQNVVGSNDCGSLPWGHLLHGGELNRDHAQLVGAFGHPRLGFHSELKCLLNGEHDNQLYYGGDGDLRSRDRLCNFCRELTHFRVLERTGRLGPLEDTWERWQTLLRPHFYSAHSLLVPEQLPQPTSDGTPWFQACHE